MHFRDLLTLLCKRSTAAFVVYFRVYVYTGISQTPVVITPMLGRVPELCMDFRSACVGLS